MEWWNSAEEIGMMEKWNIGILGTKAGRNPSFHYSNIPMFQFIVILLFHCSNIPSSLGGEL